jgi:hypothetical protein
MTKLGVGPFLVSSRTRSPILTSAEEQGWGRLSNTVRILKSANPNDTAPGWKLAIVPTATSFTVKRTVNTDAGNRDDISLQRLKDD